MSSSVPSARDAAPWYAGGLRFACRACGRCCGGAPGYVWVEEEEIAALASAVGLTPREFRRLYVRRMWRGLSLREKENFDCVLLDAAGRCVAYDARPVQCRTWPFWPSNLASPEAWKVASSRCPGIDHGPLYTFGQIEALRLKVVV